MRFIRRDDVQRSGWVIRYQLDDRDFAAEVNASQLGVSLGGRWPIISPEDTILLEEAISRARIHAQHLLEHPGEPPLTEAQVWKALMSMFPDIDDYAPSPFFVEESQ